jgi:hypothetical protein
MILAMATPVQCRAVGSSRSITSMQTRRGTRKATLETLVMRGAVNTTPDIRAGGMAAAITAAVVIAEKQFDWEMMFELQLRVDHGPNPSVTPRL